LQPADNSRIFSVAIKQSRKSLPLAKRRRLSAEREAERLRLNARKKLVNGRERREIHISARIAGRLSSRNNNIDIRKKCISAIHRAGPTVATERRHLTQCRATNRLALAKRKKETVKIDIIPSCDATIRDDPICMRV